MNLLSECYRSVVEAFESANFEDSLLEARLLLCHILGLSEAQFLARLQDPISKDLHRKLTRYVTRRLKGVPLAYVLGEWGFMGHVYRVGPGVLIPRPETELLVRKVCEFIQNQGWGSQPITILELGFGSGIISIELALKFKQARVLGWDKSARAYQRGCENALKLGASTRFYKQDFFLGESIWGPILESADPVLVVSNPPYVTLNDWELLMPGVKYFEPKMALVGGRDGLAFYQKIAQRIAGRCPIAVEIGSGQGESISRIFKTQGWDRCEVFLDFCSHTRVVFAS